MLQPLIAQASSNLRPFRPLCISTLAEIKQGQAAQKTTGDRVLAETQKGLAQANQRIAELASSQGMFAGNLSDLQRVVRTSLAKVNRVSPDAPGAGKSERHKSPGPIAPWRIPPAAKLLMAYVARGESLTELATLLSIPISVIKDLNIEIRDYDDTLGMSAPGWVFVPATVGLIEGRTKPIPKGKS